MRIDAAGHHDLARGIDCFGCGGRVAAAPHSHDLSASQPDIAFEAGSIADDRAISNYGVDHDSSASVVLGRLLAAYTSRRPSVRSSTSITPKVTTMVTDDTAGISGVKLTSTSANMRTGNVTAWGVLRN